MLSFTGADALGFEQALLYRFNAGLDGKVGLGESDFRLLRVKAQWIAERSG